MTRGALVQTAVRNHHNKLFGDPHGQSPPCVSKLGLIASLAADSDAVYRATLRTGG
jgi:hypothetical protein